MPSSNEYLEFVLGQLSKLDHISYRSMMGEFVIYYRDKVVGGIYDNRFLVKPTKSAIAMVPDAERAIPYPGAKEMLLVDVDNQELLTNILKVIYEELPATKKKKQP